MLLMGGGGGGGLCRVVAMIVCREGSDGEVRVVVTSGRSVLGGG